MTDDTKTHIDNAVNELTQIIDTTHCGYCKAIVGDARNILTKYESVMEQAEELDHIQRNQNEFLDQTSLQASKVIEQYKQPVMTQNDPSPESSPGMVPGARFGGRIQGMLGNAASSPGMGGMIGKSGPLSRLGGRMNNNMQRPVIKNMFGDVLPLNKLLSD